MSIIPIVIGRNGREMEREVTGSGKNRRIGSVGQRQVKIVVRTSNYYLWSPTVS
jgi:hypothetical protein